MVFILASGTQKHLQSDWFAIKQANNYTVNVSTMSTVRLKVVFFHGLEEAKI